MSANAYKVLHLLGVFLMLASLGGLSVAGLAGGIGDRGRKLVAIAHGIGLVIVLVAGFGLLARLDYGFAPWVILKLVLWLLFGAALVFARKARGATATLAFWAMPVLAALAAWLAFYKPGM